MTTKTIASKILAFAWLFGTQACANQAADENYDDSHEAEFGDDSQIVLAGEGASDSGQSVFADVKPALATGFSVMHNWEYNLTPELKQFVEFRFESAMVATANGSWATAPGKAFLRLRSTELSNPTISRTETVFNQQDVVYTYANGSFYAEVAGHRISIEDREHVRIDWAPGASADLLALGNELGAASTYDFGVSGTTKASGRLWDAMNTRITRDGERDALEVLFFQPRLSRRSIHESGLVVSCMAARRTFNHSQYKEKECRMSLIGDVVGGANQDFVVQKVFRGESAARIFDQLVGGETERGFVFEGGSLGCRKTGGETMCIAQLTHEPSRTYTPSP